MEVNNLLCVGRGRLSTFGKVNLPHSSFLTPDTGVSRVVKPESGLSENELIARMASNVSTGCASPPTKSILRGKVPSPKQGSPSSLRNVRFLDKEREEEVMYAKIHVNKNVQTENCDKSKAASEEKYGGLKLQFTENFTQSDQPDAYEIKTSTPRYNRAEETPSLDFDTPRGREEKTKSIRQPPRADKTQFSCGSTQNADVKSKKVPEHERIIIDIDIDRKKPKEVGTKVSESKLPECKVHTGRKMTANVEQVGNRIIQNMDLNFSARSHSPERVKQKVPDGNAIIRNMELNGDESGTKCKSVASQTSGSDASSPKSASPETPFSNRNIPDGNEIIKNMELISQNSSLNTTTDIPDGNKIIQNIELGLNDSSRESKTKSVLAKAKPKGKKIVQNVETSPVPFNSKNKSGEVQTADPEDLNEQRFRSILIQTEFENFEKDSPNDSFDESGSRSIGTQVPEPAASNIPDGSQIIRNMEIHKTQNPKHDTGSSEDKKSLNDGNWNEFVRHLQLFNPSSSSSSSVSVSDDEPPPTPISEPVLVYDGNAPSPQAGSPVPLITQNQNQMCLSSQRVSERSARTFLESEAYDREKFESVLREEGLLSKLEAVLKPSVEGPKTAKTMVDRAFEKTMKLAGDIETVKGRPNVLTHKGNSEQIRKYGQKINEGRQSSVFNSKSIDDQKLLEENRSRKPEKDTLGFTQIETYSFNPESLVRTASNKAYCSPKPTSPKIKTNLIPTSDATKHRLPSSQVKESITKNAFVKGLNLGPLPNSLPTRPSTSSNFSSLTRALDPYKSCQTDISSSRLSAARYESASTARLNGNFSTSAVRSFRTSSPCSRDTISWSGNNRSSYSHVTGHSPSMLVPIHRRAQSFKTSSSQYRPSSAPMTRSKLYPRASTLTTSLKEMRNNAVRKTAMSHYFDDKRNAFADGTNKLSLCANGRDYDEHKSTTSRVNDSLIRSDARYSSSNVRSSSPDYLNALHSKSNARPRSRERSRSRSPIQSARSAYDKTYAEIKQSAFLHENTRGCLSSNAEFGTSKNITKDNENFGNIESVTARSLHSKSESTTVKGNIARQDETTSRKLLAQRESRSLTKKPPLPPRSPKSSRSRSRSADRKVGDTPNKVNDVKAKREPEYSTTKVPKTSPVFKEAPEINETAANDTKERSTQGIVTIGAVPSGLVDSECMFLGHDTIQKIIEDAKL